MGTMALRLAILVARADSSSERGAATQIGNKDDARIKAEEDHHHTGMVGPSTSASVAGPGVLSGRRPDRLGCRCQLSSESSATAPVLVDPPGR